MKFMFLLVVVLTARFIKSDGAKILGVFPTPSRSHNMVLGSLMVELSKRGHNVTVITADPVKNNNPYLTNFREIDMHNLSYAIYYKSFDFVETKFKVTSTRKIVQNFYDMLIEVSDAQFGTPELQQLLNDKDEHFDLVIAEAIVPVASAFKVKYNCPLILMTSLGFAPHHMDIFGNPAHPILFPDNFAPYDPRNMVMWQKVDLLFRYFMYKVYYYIIYMPRFNTVMRKYFGQHFESAAVIERDADMIFVNYNPIWHGVLPTVPAVVGITGIHIKPPTPLPNHLQKLLDDSPQGVIYFSFGSNVKATSLPESARQIFIETFRNLPYLVIWKWEGEKLPNKPDNVYISKWLPQMSILAHPNVKVFVTQAGQQSVEEAIESGMPMVAIPFIFDQVANAFRMEKHGVGRHLMIENLNEATLREAILDVINNPSYRGNASVLRTLFKDQPQNSMDRAVWWTEYVIRHKGAKHLRSPAADVSFIDYFMLDVVLILSLCVALMMYPLIKLKRVMSRYSIRVRTGEAKKLT